MLWCVALLWVVWATASSGCDSDLDCSLNGVCQSNGCICDPQWEGSQCERLSQLETSPQSDINEPITSTWGAGTLHHPINGTYHVYVSEIVDNCGITSWQTNSQIVHFTADSPVGPWKRKGVAVPVWAHCGSVALTPNGSIIMWSFRRPGTKPRNSTAASGELCRGGASPCGMKHACNATQPNPSPTLSGYTTINGVCGTDNGSTKVPQHCGPDACFNGTYWNTTLQLCSALPCTSLETCLKAAAARCDANIQCKSFSYDPNWKLNFAKFFNAGEKQMVSVEGWNSYLKTSSMGTRIEDSGMHSYANPLLGATVSLLIADTPEGPWREYLPSGDWPDFSIAAPWILRNGTAFFVLQSGFFPSWYPKDQRFANTASIVRAESWKGPYEVIAQGAIGPGEDPSMWVDHRGHAHCLYHRYPFNHTEKNGGHSFSIDGRNPWYCVDGAGGHGACSMQSPHAYNTTVLYTKVGALKFGTRERPHLLFDENSVPIALTTSLQHCQPPGARDTNSSNSLCVNRWPGYFDRAWTSVVPIKQN